MSEPVHPSSGDPPSPHHPREGASATPSHALIHDDRDGVPRSVVWGVTAIIVLMIVGGVIGIFATHRPSSAAASGLPRPVRLRTAKSAPPSANPPPPAPSTAAGGIALPTSAPAMRAQGASQVARSRRWASLPPRRDPDVYVKQFLQMAQELGISPRSRRIHRPAAAEDGVVIQPVTLELSATFPKAVLFLQRMRDSMPFATPEGFVMAQRPRTDTSPPVMVPPLITLNLHLADDRAAAAAPPAEVRGDAADPDPPVDLAGALAETARVARGHVAVVEIEFRPGAGDPSVARRNFLWLSGLALNDGDVADLLVRLGGSPRFADVNLVTSDVTVLEGCRVRGFTIKYRVRSPDELRVTGSRTANRALRGDDVPDVFCFPPSLEAAIGREQPGTASNPNAKPPPPQPTSDLERRLGRFRLEAVVDATTCVINGEVVKVGEEIDGFTVGKINANSIEVRAWSGEGFEIRLKRK